TSRHIDSIFDETLCNLEDLSLPGLHNGRFKMTRIMVKLRCLLTLPVRIVE
mgnify:CR=1